MLGTHAFTPRYAYMLHTLISILACAGLLKMPLVVLSGKSAGIWPAGPDAAIESVG